MGRRWDTHGGTDRPVSTDVTATWVCWSVRTSRESPTRRGWLAAGLRTRSAGSSRLLQCPDARSSPFGAGAVLEAESVQDQGTGAGLQAEDLRFGDHRWWTLGGGVAAVVNPADPDPGMIRSQCEALGRVVISGTTIRSALVGSARTAPMWPSTAGSADGQHSRRGRSLSARVDPAGYRGAGEFVPQLVGAARARGARTVEDSAGPSGPVVPVHSSDGRVWVPLGAVPGRTARPAWRGEPPWRSRPCSPPVGSGSSCRQNPSPPCWRTTAAKELAR